MENCDEGNNNLNINENEEELNSEEEIIESSDTNSQSEASTTGINKIQIKQLLHKLILTQKTMMNLFLKTHKSL